MGTARPGANSSLWILLDFLLASLPIVRKTHSAGRQGVDNPLTIHGCTVPEAFARIRENSGHSMRRAWDSNPQVLPDNGFQVYGRAS